MKKVIFILLLCIAQISFGQINLNNNTVFIDQNGLLNYNFVHGIASTDSIAYSVGATQNIYYKLNPTGADTLKDHESDGVYFIYDSIKINYAGDYRVHCWLNLSTSNASDKKGIEPLF